LSLPEDQKLQEARAHKSADRIEEARTALSQGDMNKAETQAKQVINSAPNEPEAYAILAQVLRSSGRFSEAAENFKIAIELSPSSPDIYMNYGVLMASLDRLEEGWKSLPVLTISLKSGIQMIVPDLLSTLTTYVLLEQERWFEDEIDFVAKVLQPGDQAIDIGANYGSYSLTASKCVGDQGRVWAFEPASFTAGFLRRSLQHVNATNVIVTNSAMSNQVGMASFQVSTNSELSSLGDAKQVVSTEQVPTTTLDHCAVQLEWSEIEFLKIDTEGHEQQVLSGGRKFFSDETPLVMYEVAEPGKARKKLVDKFASYGYGSYRLLPGLGILVPIDSSSLAQVDILNLFSCKADRAARLFSRDLLIDEIGLLPKLIESAWRQFLEGLENSDSQEDLIEELGQADTEDRIIYREAIGWYAMSRSGQLPMPQRYACLLYCASLLEPISDPDNPVKIPYFTLFTRVTLDLGWQSKAVEALTPVVVRILSGGLMPLFDPAIPILSRFDNINPAGQTHDWLVANVIEAYHHNVYFSSLRAEMPQLKIYDFLKSNSFSDREMTRSRLLLRNRLGFLPDTQADDPVYKAAPDNLNAGFWVKQFGIDQS